MIDIKRISKETFKYNFHTHTQFCDGRNCMEDFVIHAINNGLEHYGFSPHGPTSISQLCNMSFDSVRDYLEEVNRLKNKYGSYINLYAAMEIDYINENENPASEYYQKLPLDYRIGSVHYISSQDGIYVDIDGKQERFKESMERYFYGDIEYVINKFYTSTTKMIEIGGFDIIGHLDKIGHNASFVHPDIETQPFYTQKVMDLLDLISEKKLIVEINTKAFYNYNRLFPNERYFRRIKELNIPVVFNSDAHYSDKIDSGRYEAKGLFDSVVI